MRGPLVAAVLLLAGPALGARPPLRSGRAAASRSTPSTAVARLPAQDSASLSGRVVGGPRSRPLPFASLTLLPQGLDTVADEQGRFRFDRAAPGPVELVVAVDGWRRLTVSADLLAGEDLEIEAHLRRGRRPRNETLVRADPPWREIARHPLTPDRGLDPGLRSLSARDLEREPGSLGDPLRALQSLPETAGDVGNQAGMRLRGGLPEETILEIDGIRIEAPLHMAGVVSVFQADLLDSVDLYASSPPASRPDSLSGGLYARYRRGATDRLDGTFDLSFLGASLSMEARLDPAGRHTLIAGVRQSFIGPYMAAAAALSSGPKPAGDYGEVFLRYQGAVAPRHEVSATLLLSRDSFRFDDVNEQHRLNGGSVDWRHTFGLGCSVDVQLAQSSTSQGEPPADGFRYPFQRAWRDDTHRTQLRAAFHHRDRQREVAVGLEASITARDYGGQVRDTRALPRWSWLPLAELDLPLRTLRATVVVPELIVWGEVQYRNLLGPLSVRAGVRASLWNRSRSPHVSPRIALSLPLPTGTTISGTFALTQQQRMDALVLDPKLGGPDLQPERAFHLSAAINQVILSWLVARVEGWHTAYDQLVVYPDGPDAPERGGWTNDGYGQASGLDLTLEARRGRVSGSAAYGLSRSVRTNPLSVVFPAETAAGGDRRHFVHVGGALEIGPRRGLLLGVDYLYRSGWAIGTLDRRVLDDGRTALWSVVSLDDRRRPDLHRISLRVEGTHSLKRVQLRGYVEVAATASGGGAIEDCPSSSETAALPACRSLDFLPSIMPWAGLRARW